MKTVELILIYNGTWKTNEICFEENIGLFLKRVFENNFNKNNDFILSLHSMHFSQKIYFIMVDESNHLLTLNSPVPKKLKLVAISVDDLTEKEIEHLFIEDKNDYLYPPNEILHINPILVPTKKDKSLVDPKIEEIIEKKEKKEEKKPQIVEEEKNSKKQEKPIEKKNTEKDESKEKPQQTNKKKIEKKPVEKKIASVKREKKKENIRQKKEVMNQKPSNMKVIVLLNESSSTVVTLVDNKEKKAKKKEEKDKNKSEIQIPIVPKEQPKTIKKEDMENQKKKEEEQKKKIERIVSADKAEDRIPPKQQETQPPKEKKEEEKKRVFEAIDFLKKEEPEKKEQPEIDIASDGISMDSNTRVVESQEKVKVEQVSTREEEKEDAPKEVEQPKDSNAKETESNPNDTGQEKEKKEGQQTISYTIVSPTNEVLYHKEIQLTQPISVADLLLQTGLDIQNSNGFVQAINGISNEGMSGWVYEVNETPVMVSATDYMVNSSDTIKWKYVDFSKMDEKGKEDSTEKETEKVFTKVNKNKD